jgi:hypothetical protein
MQRASHVTKATGGRKKWADVTVHMSNSSIFLRLGISLTDKKMINCRSLGIKHDTKLLGLSDRVIIFELWGTRGLKREHS